MKRQSEIATGANTTILSPTSTDSSYKALTIKPGSRIKIKMAETGTATDHRLKYYRRIRNAQNVPEYSDGNKDLGASYSAPSTVLGFSDVHSEKHQSQAFLPNVSTR